MVSDLGGPHLAWNFSFSTSNGSLGYLSNWEKSFWVNLVVNGLFAGPKYPDDPVSSEPNFLGNRAKGICLEPK